PSVEVDRRARRVIGVDARGEPDRYPDAAVAAGIERNRRVAVDREASEEEGRIEHPVGEPAGHLAVDMPAPDGRITRRSCRDMADQDDARAPYDGENLDRHAHLDIVAGIAGARRAR